MKTTYLLPWTMFGLLVWCTCGALQGEEGGQPTVGMPQAEAGGLIVAVSSGVHFPRPNAPLPITISVRCTGQQTRTGQVQLTLEEGEQPLLTWRSPDWTVTSSGRTQAVLLPPLPLPENHQELNVLMQWVEDDRPTTFPVLQLTSAGSSSRPLVMAYCSGVGVDRKALIAATSLAGILSSSTSKDWHADAHVMTENLTVDQVPGDPLALCAYEVVVLGGDAIVQLTDHQLSALLTWVKGGGSLAIISGSAAATATDGFLQQAGIGAGPDVQDCPSAMRLEHVGLGRVAVRSLESINDSGATDSSMALFLWKIQGHWQEALRLGGPLDPAALGKTSVANPYNYYAYNRHVHGADADEISFLAEEAETVQQSLSMYLMPSHVGMVPFSLVALIVILFALAIGPGDWFLLGRFQAHRFTWVLFPALSIVCTVALMLLANHYLGGNERRTRLAIVDCGERGSVLRCDLFESVFSGQAGPAGSHLHHALWAPMGDTVGRYGYRRNGGMDDRLAPPNYNGAMPGDYTVNKDVSQWSPSLRRSLMFSNPGDLPVRLPDRLTLSQARSFTASLLTQVHGLYATYWYGDSHTDLAGSVSSLATSQNVNEAYYGQWLDQICVAPKRGWFTLASQISPCGGNIYDDLPVYDKSDTSHWLLVMAVRQQNTLYIERRLYQTSGTEALP